MGIYSVNFFPTNTKKNQVAEFLEILGYKKVSGNHLFYYEENNLEQVTAVVADIINSKREGLQVQISTTIWRSIFDHEIHNLTIKRLKQRFGGHFSTSDGMNRYLVFDGIIRRKDEAACHLAYFHFSNNLSNIKYYLQTLRSAFPFTKPLPIDDYNNPVSTHTTIGTPFLVTILEEYLRSAYIGLLTYSDKKKVIFKSARISNELLFDVTLKEITLEKVIAQSKSFQNIAQINLNFKEINDKVNFIDILNRNNPQSNYLERLNSLIELRHKIIHEAVRVPNYSIENFQENINLIGEVVSLFYSQLQKSYGWQDHDF